MRRWVFVFLSFFSLLFVASFIDFSIASAQDKQLSESDIIDLVRKAEQGDAEAQFNLGTLYTFGDGVTQDYNKAKEMYEKSAAQGLADSQNALGWMYSTGAGYAQNYAKAIEWYEKSAEQGNAKGQYGLGMLYALEESTQREEGLPRSYVLAYKWLDLAANQFDDARVSRDDLTKKMTPEQIAEAQRLAREWKPKTEKPPQ